MKKTLVCICFALGLTLFQGVLVRADFASFVVGNYTQQQERIWQSSARHYRSVVLKNDSPAAQSSRIKTIWAWIIFIVIVWILLWFLRRLFWEWKEIKGENVSLDDTERFISPEFLSAQRLIQEGKAALRQDPMYATGKFQAALDLPLADLQKKEVHHYLGIAYLERFRRENNVEDEAHIRGDFMTYQNPYLLKESQVHLLEAQRMGEGDNLFQLDNKSWLISLYSFLKDHQKALDTAYEALNLAQNNGETEKQEYLLNKINHLKKQIEKRDASEKSTAYPKELQPDTVEVL